jgi:hypothetical protein
MSLFPSVHPDCRETSTGKWDAGRTRRSSLAAALFSPPSREGRPGRSVREEAILELRHG